MAETLNKYAAALLTVCIGLAGCATPRLGDSEAALVLEDLTATGYTSRLRSRVPDLSRKQVYYPSAGRRYAADLYRVPGAGPQTGILLLPGITPAGKNDSRLVALARTLARSGFTVLVPDIPGFRSFRLSSADVRHITDAYEYFSRRPEQARSRTGICAISFAVGPAVLAALQPETRDRVDFIIGVGGYHDLAQVVTFATTGYFREPGATRWERLSPSVYGQALLALSNAPLLPQASDRRALSGYARDLLQGQPEEEGLTGNVLHLQPGGEALLALITNRDPERTALLMGRLPRPVQTQMAALNPAAHDLSQLEASLMLLHGRSDNVIPYTQSLAMVAAVGPDQARLYLIDGLAHVDLRPKRRDLPVLLEFIERVLSER
jgi:pimeloyl-ACP methyl ester carboxylesterase